MKRKKEVVSGQEEAVKTKWFTLTYKGVICILVLAFMIGMFSVLIFNIGYDPQTGKWYWKPNNLSVEIKKKNKE